MMRDKNKIAYASHKCAAKKRGIEFLLSYEEWIGIWNASGKERGRGSDKYCMARHGDVGPYSVDNVSIITNRENLSLGNKDRWKGKVLSDETKQKVRDARAKQTNLGHDKRIFVCQHCNQTIRSASNLLQHTRAKHTL